MCGLSNFTACFKNVIGEKVQHVKDMAFNLEQRCDKWRDPLCRSLLEEHPLYNINNFDTFEHLTFLMKLEVHLKFYKL